MKKEEFMEKLRQAARISDLEISAEFLMDTGAIDISRMDPQSFLDVYPVAVALLRHEADRIENGASNPLVNARIRRKANKIMKFLK